MRPPSNETFLHKSASILVFGDFAWFMFFCTLMVGIFAWYIVSRDISSGIEKICSFFLPPFAILVTIFTLVVMFLPGAWNGFGYYMIPNFSVLSNPRLWLDAFGHIFFSLSFLQHPLYCPGLPDLRIHYCSHS